MDGHLIRFDKKSRFCFVDIESFNLCLSLKFNRPWQIGLIEYRGDTIQKSKDVVINWPVVNGLTCSEGAARINHYNQFTVARDGMSPEEGFAFLDSYLTNCEYIVGHNLFGFDLYLIRDMYRMFGKPWRHLAPKVIDTKAIASGVKMGVPFDSSKESITMYQYRMGNTRVKGVKTALSTLAKEYGIKLDETRLHEALYDLEINIQVWNKLKFQIDL